MNTKNVEALKVIEIPYGDIGWGLDVNNKEAGIQSNLQHWTEPRELHDYHLCGIYHTADVPVTIDEIQYEPKDGERVYETLSRSVSDAVCTGLLEGKSVLLTGGYCMYGVPVAGGIQRAFGPETKVGIIYLDAHGDINTPESTNSGMLGGMPLATVLGLCFEDWRRFVGIEVPYRDTDVLLSDARDVDQGELANLSRLGVKVLDTKAFCDADQWKAAVEELAKRVDVLYLHVDADILDGRYVPDHFTIEMGGPDINTVLRNIKTVMDTGKVAVYNLNSIYFNTGEEKEGREVSTLSGLKLIAAGLGNWKKCPSLG